MAVKSFALAETIIPTKKQTTQHVRSGIRPYTEDNAAMGSWKMAELRRKLVPDQNASMAVPLRSFAMICILSHEGVLSVGGGADW
jgi:hypothetical protein